jgi:hypothetical protein
LAIRWHQIPNSAWRSAGSTYQIQLGDPLAPHTTPQLQSLEKKSHHPQTFHYPSSTKPKISAPGLKVSPQPNQLHLDAHRNQAFRLSVC